MSAPRPAQWRPEMTLASQGRCKVEPPRAEIYPGLYPNPSVAKISGTSLSISSLSTGNFLKYNGTNWVNSTPAVADLSDASSLIKSSQMPANCAAGQTLTFSSPTGTWACTNVSIAWSQITSGTPTTIAGYGITDANGFQLSGTRNLAGGTLALSSVTTGVENTAVGLNALKISPHAVIIQLLDTMRVSVW